MRGIIALLAFAVLSPARSQTDIWQDMTPSVPGHIAVNKNTGHVFVGYQGRYTLFTESPGAGVFRSTDNGANWQVVNSGLTSTNIVGLHCTSNGILIAGTHLDRVFRSSDNGSTWTQVPVTARLSWFASKGDTIFGSDGYWCRGVFRSTNGGVTWMQVNSGLDPCVNGLTISAAGNVFAATGTSGVYRSTNWGANWIPTNSGITSSNCSPITATASGHVLVGTVTDGVFHSSNEGNSWTAVNSGLPSLNAIRLAANSAGHIFAGIHPAGLFRSTNNGSSWSAFNLGIIDSVRDVGSIEFAPAGYAWIQTTGRIYRSIDPILSVRLQSPEPPTSFWLGQNYPNPFNPNTTVEFGLPSESAVSIKVFNVLGQEVATILEDHLPAGTYKVAWNAQPFASGTYFYRLVAGSHSEVKKLMLQK